MKKVVFTSDVLRTTDGDANQIYNAFLLQELMGDIIYRTTGIIPEIRYRSYGKIASVKWLDRVFNAINQEPSADGWAKTFWLNVLPDDLIDIFEEEYRNCFVICFEMSPLMGCLLDRIGVPWVNVNLSPLRFLSDLILEFRFSHHVNREELLKYDISTYEINHSAEHVKRWYDPVNSNHNYHNSVVFFAQTYRDRTTIGKSGFVEDDYIVDAIKRYSGSKRLYVKRHPWAETTPLTELLNKQLSCNITNDNTYKILSIEVNVDIFTVSSSVGVESPFFGKNVKILHSDVLDLERSSIRVKNAYRGTSFWRDVLGKNFDVIEEDGFQEICFNNSLRSRLLSAALPYNVWAWP